MFPVNFVKERALRYMQCLDEGRMVEPEQEEWTINEMLGLAGACFFALLSHGPVLRRTAAEIQGMVLEKPEHREHEEADYEMVCNDIHAAVACVAHLTMLAWDEEYDDAFEEFVCCFTTQEGEVSRSIKAISGFKKSRHSR